MKRGGTDATADPPRGKYLSRPGSASELSSTPAFTLTADQLAAVVRSAVAEALAEATHNAEPATVLLDRNGIAKALGCSASQVDKLRQRGMPFVRLGESPRFMIPACLQWLETQKGEPT